MSIHLERFIFTESVANPTAHALSLRMIVGGCMCPIARRIDRVHSPDWALINTPAYSDSAADATTTSMTLLITWHGPLICVGSLRFPKYCIPPPTDLPHGRYRYDASD